MFCQSLPNHLKQSHPAGVELHHVFCCKHWLAAIYIETSLLRSAARLCHDVLGRLALGEPWPLHRSCSVCSAWLSSASHSVWSTAFTLQAAWFLDFLRFALWSLPKLCSRLVLRLPRVHSARLPPTERAVLGYSCPYKWLGNRCKHQTLMNTACSCFRLPSELWTDARTPRTGLLCGVLETIAARSSIARHKLLAEDLLAKIVTKVAPSINFNFCTRCPMSKYFSHRAELAFDMPKWSPSYSNAKAFPVLPFSAKRRMTAASSMSLAILPFPICRLT